ncbi:Magnesium transport protein CorA [compost metagenome]
MIRTLAVTNDLQLLLDLPLNELSRADIQWYWVDFDAPSQEEAMLLEHHFHFHPLAIDDCFHLLQRAKLDHYEGVHFFVLHALHQQSLNAEEVDIFLGDHFLVTFHWTQQREIEDAWSKVLKDPKLWESGPITALHLVIDKLVDEYFPCVHLIEDQLSDLDNEGGSQIPPLLMKQVFDIRSKLLKLRRTILPMRDLMYRVINSDRIVGLKPHVPYFTDIYDHLLKLSDMLDNNRELTADLRDSYISLNSYRMNTIMKTLTVITTIFMPLTFIAGIYGMNFDFMPELYWKYGYFVILAVMAGIGITMFTWFRKKGWFH